MIFKILNWKPDKLEFDTSKPVGALSRALDNERANNLLVWSPKFNLEDGLRKTIDWYKTSHKIEGNVDQDILLESK